MCHCLYEWLTSARIRRLSEDVAPRPDHCVGDAAACGDGVDAGVARQARRRSGHRGVDGPRSSSAATTCLDAAATVGRIVRVDARRSTATPPGRRRARAIFSARASPLSIA